MRIFILSLFSLFALNAFAQTNESVLRAFAFYSSKGKELTFEEALHTLAKSDVILFGELHNSAIIHWLQYRTLKALDDLGKNLIIGGEFMEKDDQIKIDEFLSGWINEVQFEDAARFWKNYQTDYKPILNFAKDSALPFIATNVPRRYAAIVSKWGLDTLVNLPAKAQEFLPRLPIDFDMNTPGYKAMLSIMEAHGEKFSAKNMVKAQALKDATMAQSIAENSDQNTLFFHINGDYHSANYGGIYWYLHNIKSKLDISIVKVYTGKTLDFKENWAKSGDIILVVPEDFTRSY